MLPTPYYQADGITLYCADMRAVVPYLGRVDACITDPCYAETSLKWDRWVDGWPSLILPITNTLWCFGSFKMFLRRLAEFEGWTVAQDIVWQKHNGSNFSKDRFKRIHELAVHFYQGAWNSQQRAVPRVPSTSSRKKHVPKRCRTPHTGAIGSKGYVDDGFRLTSSVIPCRSCHGRAVNETQKPEGIIAPLVTYSVPPGGVTLDCFAGSGTTLVVARAQRRQAIGIELRESQCEEIVKRLKHTDSS